MQIERLKFPGRKTFTQSLFPSRYVRRRRGASHNNNNRWLLLWSKASSAAGTRPLFVACNWRNEPVIYWPNGGRLEIGQLQSDGGPTSGQIMTSVNRTAAGRSAPDNIVQQQVVRATSRGGRASRDRFPRQARPSGSGSGEKV